jgi:hypothetical protein
VYIPAGLQTAFSAQTKNEHIRGDKAWRSIGDQSSQNVLFITKKTEKELYAKESPIRRPRQSTFFHRRKNCDIRKDFVKRITKSVSFAESLMKNGRKRTGENLFFFCFGGGYKKTPLFL